MQSGDVIRIHPQQIADCVGVFGAIQLMEFTSATPIRLYEAVLPSAARTLGLGRPWLNAGNAATSSSFSSGLLLQRRTVALPPVRPSMSLCPRRFATYHCRNDPPTPHSFEAFELNAGRVHHSVAAQAAQ